MERPRELTFERDPPPIEWHLTGDPDKFDIITVKNNLNPLQATLAISRQMFYVACGRAP